MKAGDSVYDSSGNLLGKADGCYARPTYKSPGSVCLIRKGKFIWVSGNVEKRENVIKVLFLCKKKMGNNVVFYCIKKMKCLFY